MNARTERSWSRRARGAGLALIALVIAGPAFAAPKVVVSVKPIHSLVAGVMGEVGTPTLLLSGLSNPHAYALRPSEAHALADADLVVWVGPTMESFLVRALAALPPRVHVLTLVEAKDVTRLPIRAGGLFEPDADDADHDHAPGGTDGHIWLDPRNAQAIVATVRDALVALDPVHAETYTRNSATVTADLAALDRELAQTLQPVKGASFIVFHDAYQYLEHRYGLAVAGSVTLGADTAAHARRISALRRRIDTHHIQCVFAEPQFSPALVQTVVEGTAARTGVLDHLGAAHPEGPALYDALMRDMAQALVSCLTP